MSDATAAPSPSSIVDTMQSMLRDAMRARDRVAVSALRTALAAVANAEAAPIDAAPTEVRGRLVEHERVVLDEDAVAAVVRAQVADRHATIDEIVAHGRESEAEILRVEADVLERVLATRP